MAVLSALTSVVGAGVAPTLQAVKNRAAVRSSSSTCRIDLLENIIVTSEIKRVIVMTGMIRNGVIQSIILQGH